MKFTVWICENDDDGSISWSVNVCVYGHLPTYPYQPYELVICESGDDASVIYGSESDECDAICENLFWIHDVNDDDVRLPVIYGSDDVICETICEIPYEKLFYDHLPDRPLLLYIILSE
jgi:hypothetical protein